jgi:aromatic-L-amino-acid decarboxylase
MESSPLELSTERWQELVDAAVKRLSAFLQANPKSLAADLEGSAEIAATFSEGVPEGGIEFEALLDRLFEQAIPKALNTTHPGYLAYVPGGGLLHASVADLIADVTNRFVGAQFASPVLAQIEGTVIRWFCEFLGMGPKAGGILTTGGSLANLSGVITARHQRLGEDFLDGSAYLSTQAHHSVAKALKLAGIPGRGIRLVPADEQGRMRLDLLQEAIEGDRDAGHRPFLLVGNAGTTNTGAVDDLTGQARIAGEENLHFHVDGAYGGFFAMTERGRHTLAGIERADSITLDPHKGLFLPYGTGCLLVRDPQALQAAHGAEADYLPPGVDDMDPRADFMSLSPELSRGNRSLRLWLPFQMHGATAFEGMLNEKLDLARHASERLGAHPGIVLFNQPSLSLLAFRLRAEGASSEELDSRTAQWLDGVNARGRVHLTHTRVGGKLWARICVLSFRTHLEHVDHGVEDLLSTVNEFLP